MLVIRSEQRRILANRLLVDRLSSHAQQVAPEVCSSITEDHLRQVVSYCLARSAYYQLDREYDIYRYLNLMLVFGFTFDKDEPWAAGPLAFRNPAGRMDLLMDAAYQRIGATEARHES